MQKTQTSLFFTKSQKNENRKIYFLCHNFCTNKDLEPPQNDRLNLSFVKDGHMVVEQMLLNDHEIAICQSVLNRNSLTPCLSLLDF